MKVRTIGFVVICFKILIFVTIDTTHQQKDLREYRCDLL